MKSCAIIGFYSETLPALLASQAEEFWVPNHGVMVMGEAVIPHCERMFEIHKEAWFRRKEMPKFQEYWEWLCQPHPFPIYMQQALPEIPSAVTYPFEDVCADLFPHLLRMGTEGAEIRDTYLTSSAAFMLAQAIHERYERVEIYGIEMATDTEYGYQRPGFEYMIGLANGRGIDVVLQHNSEVCRSFIYAYDVVPFIGLPRLVDLKAHYLSTYKQLKAEADHKLDDFNHHRSDDREGTLQAMDIAGGYKGAVELIERLMGPESDYLSRQALEVRKRAYVAFCNRAQAEVNAQLGVFESLVKRGAKAEADAVWRKYLDARATMFANMGAVQCFDNLIAECDLRKSNHEIVLTIKDV